MTDQGMAAHGVAIVTGGASGIGLSIAKALLGDGWKIVLADLAQGPLDVARAELDLTGTFTVSREARRLMRGHGGGTIINIASVSG